MAADGHGQFLIFRRAAGFENDAVIVSRRFERDIRPTTGELPTGAVEVCPADSRELADMGVGPERRA